VIFLLIYLDDIIVASSSNAATEALLKHLHADFALRILVSFIISWTLRSRRHVMGFC
jgi:hypothetical protein